MTRAWQLPEHLADVLPGPARRMEALRRTLIDHAARRGYELVIPPLLEHLDALLSGSDAELELRTFKLVDQASGRSLGLRADTTPQVARIDAHLLNRSGVTRLCYCGPVLHTRPEGTGATREPMQFGAELFGHAGRQADLEVQDLAIESLQAAGLTSLVLDLADARLLRAVLAGVVLGPQQLQEIAAALAAKDAPLLAELSATLAPAVRDALQALTQLYGDDEVLDEALQRLPQRPAVQRALDELRWLAARLREAHPELSVTFDLADMGGYGYYSATRFAIYAQGASDALARGGRYDEVGAVFGRSRAAVGFSLDLKPVAELLGPLDAEPSIRAPWQDDVQLRLAVRRLRLQGETVVWQFDGAAAGDGSALGAGVRALADGADRELVRRDGRWLVQALASSAAAGGVAPAVASTVTPAEPVAVPSFPAAAPPERERLA